MPTATLEQPEVQSKSMQQVNFNVSSFDEETRSFLAVASTDVVDRQGDIVDQKGWDLSFFKQNPVILWGHDYNCLPVAKAIEIGFTDGKLMFRPSFATAEMNPQAEMLWKLYKGGFMRAFSVGFIPIERDGNTFTKSQLLEISCVTVPANPEALALAYKDGTISFNEKKSLLGALKAQVKALETLAIIDTTITEQPMSEATEEKTGATHSETTKKMLKELHGHASAMVSSLKAMLGEDEGDTETAGEKATKPSIQKTEGEVTEEETEETKEPDTKVEPEEVSTGTEGEEMVDPEHLTEAQQEELKQAVDEAIAKSMGKVD